MRIAFDRLLVRCTGLLVASMFVASNPTFAQYWGNQMLPKYGEALGTGQIGLNPATRTVEIQGSHMIVADRYGVNIVDISNPASPVLIGRTGVPRLTKRITVSGRYIYVAEERGLAIVDFVNPTAPTVLSFVDIGTQVTDIVRRDSIVFLSTVEGILAYNVSNPANPTPVSSLTLGTASLGITIELHPTLPLLYCGANTSSRQLFTVDISNPQNMQLVSTRSLPAGGTVWSPPLVSGNRLYVIETIGVDAFDISTPTQPTMLYSQSPSWGSMYSAVLKDTLLFVAHWQIRWSVLSVAGSSGAQLLRSYDSIAVFGEGNGITKLHGNYLFLANFGKTASDVGWRVRIIDISNPLNASVVGSVASPSEGYNEAHYIFQRGTNYYAIVGQKSTIQHRSGQVQYAGFVRILDVTNPSAPTVLSTLDLPHNIIAVTTAESVAVARGVKVSTQNLGQYENWLYLLNITDLTNPIVLDQIQIRDNTQWVENQSSMIFFEGKLYVLDRTALNVYSTATSHFVLLGSTIVANASPLMSFKIRRVGNQILAYIAGGGSGSIPGGFIIYNVTNPSGMFLMSAFDTPGLATDVQLQGGYAFVTDRTGGVWVFDISNNMTVPITSVSSIGEARQCALENNLLFVRTLQGSNIYLQVFDVSNPASPVSKGTYLSDGILNFLSLSHNGRRLYLNEEYLFSVRRPLFNFRPLPFVLHQPADTSTVSGPITFVWGRAEDANDDTLTYSLRLWRTGWDTTIAVVSDTTFALAPGSLAQGTYSWTVLASDGEFQVASPDTFRFSYVTTGVGPGNDVPREFALYQNYPNPFNPTTTLRFDIPEESIVRLDVFNIIGQHVRSLKDERVAAGRYALQWDGTDDHAARVASGLYLVRMTARSEQKAGASFSQSIKLLLMK